MTISFRRHAITLLWLILMASTGVSLLSSDSSRLLPKMASVLIMLVAYVKSRFLLLDFMRIRDAPTGWRIILELWLIAVVAEILIFALAA